MSAQPIVEVFTQPHCAPCRQVEAFLRDRGVSFTPRDVVLDPSALDRLVDRGFMSTPVTRIGEEWISGFDRRRLERALAALR